MAWSSFSTCFARFQDLVTCRLVSVVVAVLSCATVLLPNVGLNVKDPRTIHRQVPRILRR